MANFLDELAYGSSQTWRDFCDEIPPRKSPDGLLKGPWRDAIVCAVACEQAGDADQFSDAPAGQVLQYLEGRGHGNFMDAADKTEAAAHRGLLALPVLDGRRICNYGAKCYRKNPDHFRELAHPWLEEAGAATPGGQAKSGVKGGGKAAHGGGKGHVTGGKGLVGSGKGGGYPATHKGDVGSTGTVPIIPPGAPPVLVHVGGSPPRPTGRQKAVLIGVNYFGTRAELRGCINDVVSIQRLLMDTYGWKAHSFRILRDDDRRSMPTRQNILAMLHWLVEDVRPGDVLFLHFSGHGAQEEDRHGYEEDGMNETILPVDFQNTGQISDDQIGDIIVKPLPSGVKLVAVMDCCHSGTGLDLPYRWHGRGWREEVNPYHSMGDVQMFSGCEDDSTSADASDPYGSAGGAMTTAFCEALRSDPCPSYPELMSRLHQSMRRHGFSQRPQLTSTQQFEWHRPFVLADILPNQNPQIGRTVRRRFPPRPKRMDGPLAELLNSGVAVAGGMLAGALLGEMLFG